MQSISAKSVDCTASTPVKRSPSNSSQIFCFSDNPKPITAAAMILEMSVVCDELRQYFTARA